MAVERDHPAISIHRQCELLGLPRSSYYYSSQGVSELDLSVMHLIDEQYTRCPFYGSRRMRDWLCDQGHHVGRDHVRRLMRLMGIRAIYPKRWLSMPGEGHHAYPYLLGGIDITYPDQVWAVDITYIRLMRGFAYLVAVMDWYSRYVVSWELSLSLDVGFCLEAMERALATARPEIVNSDQGSQFTSEEFTGVLKKAGIRISMDGKGRVFDNIMIERLWRSVKYEEVYLKEYEDLFVAMKSLGSYFLFYNKERRHQGLKGLTPQEVYRGCELSQAI
jgi:putative transposase